MEPQKVRDWLKEDKNLDKTLDRFFDEQFRLAIFMAGIPGAGKTELVRRMSPAVLAGFTIIEHDKLVELLPKYQPELAYDYRPAGSALITSILSQVIKQKRSFLIDTTLSAQAGKSNVKKALAKGYRVMVLYVYQDIRQAQTLTRKREVVTKRGISREGFVAACQKINRNLRDIFEAHQQNPLFSFIYVDKTTINKTGSPKITVYNHQDQKAADFIKQRLAQNYDPDTLPPPA